MSRSLSAFRLIEYAVAFVFIISGLMKIFSSTLGSYFISLGLPEPILIMNIVAIIEIICGIFILLGKSVKNASILLLVIMIGAFLLTKVPLLHTGLLHFAFHARLDIVMLILLYILYSKSYR
ncbi:DoxX family membrane protein [Bacillus luteolus]|uniref:DoxX family membrane protein n=1 Tax=Litchfieldia luteola TaxID=682179 RepID=A0ABR9QQ78_9BACI|nr:DoxX family membrane protein [Cytobacillus luteolus]